MFFHDLSPEREIVRDVKYFASVYDVVTKRTAEGFDKERSCSVLSAELPRQTCQPIQDTSSCVIDASNICFSTFSQPSFLEEDQGWKDLLGPL